MWRSAGGGGVCIVYQEEVGEVGGSKHSPCSSLFEVGIVLN